MNAAEAATIAEALEILNRQMKAKGKSLQNPEAIRSYLRLKLERRESEVFAILMMDAQHCVIEYKELFFGTVDGASVHPREVVKACLAANAAAVAFVHNHPSGDSTPSHADRKLTERLKDILAIVDVRALDHFIVGQNEITSFAESGWL